MTAVGGSIESFSARGRIFTVASDADAKKKLGGFTIEVQGNGDGSARKIMTRTPWSVEGLNVCIDDKLGDQEALQEIADLKDYVDITLTLASGVTLQAIGTISGDLEGSTQSTTATVNLAGPGRLTSQ